MLTVSQKLAIKKWKGVGTIAITKSEALDSLLMGTIILSVSVSPYPPLVEIVQISDFGYMSNALFYD